MLSLLSRAAVCAALTAPAVSSAQAVLPPLPEELLLPVEGAVATVPLADETVVREHVGALRIDLLEATAETRGRLSIALFDGRRIESRFLRRTEGWGAGWVWHGSVEGEAEGSVQLSVFEDAVIGSIRTTDELFKLRFAGNGLHALGQVEESRFRPCANGPEGPVAGAAAGGPGQGATPPVAGPHIGGQQAAAAAPNNPPTIDVLVVYTPQARAGQGGTNAMLALINLAVSETNTAYAQSQVGQDLRLVATAEMVGYTETSSFSTELSRLQVDGDGYMDEAHTLREQHGADAVALILNGTQYCGIGYLMGTPSADFDEWAFTATARTCATGYYSFGHELGHNFGSTHDHGNGSGASYPYSYGYRTTNGAYRTIMAYAPGTRIQRFSNPNITWAGWPLGLAEPDPQAAENWKSLNNTAPVTSQWRCAVVETLGTGKVTSLGEVPVLSAAGTASAAANALTLELSAAPPGKSAIAFYGTTQGSAPWNGGTLYVLGPKKRLPVQATNGAGNASWSFPLAGFVAGDQLFAQGWFRDPTHPDGTTVGLTNGLRIDVCP
jgi:hypothetical protein